MALVDKIVSVLHMNNDWTDELGALNGTANGATFDASGKLNEAGSTDGLDDYVNLGTDATIKALTKGAVIRWLYVPSTETANAETWSFAYGGDTVNEYTSFNVKLDGTSANFKLYQRHRENAGNLRLLISDTWYATDTWHLVMMESTGTSYNLYVDNVADTYTVSTGSNDGLWWGDNSTTNDKFVLGAIYLGGYINHFKGKTDELIILDDVTDADDRTTLWNDGDGIEYPFSVAGGSIFSLFRRRRH